MLRFFFWVLLGSFSFFTTCKGQHPYDAKLTSPLHIPLILAANLGELRTNHFHTGIDIKTNGQEGYKVYAVADGYISRIGISPYGYGKVVYINHPKLGITSVYGHCSELENTVDAVLKQYQKEQKSNQVDYYLMPDQIPVKQGQQIAFSGNTGGSTAPHLHFEIRDMFTEHPINPLLFNFLDTISDHRPPLIRGLKLYALNKDGLLISGKSAYLKVYNSNNQFVISQNTCTIPAAYCSKNGGIGFSVDVVDLLDDAPNKCGILESALIVNKDTVFKQNMSELDFATNRQINTHVDYEEFTFHKRGLQKQFKTPYNQLPIYPLQSNGVIKVLPDSSYAIQYVCCDVKGNLSILNFNLHVLPGNERAEQKGIDNYSPDFLYPDSVYNFKNDVYEIDFPAHALYEPCKKELQFSDNKLNFGNSDIPLDKSFQLKWNIAFIPTTISNHSILAVIDDKGKIYPLKTIRDGNYLIVNPKQFGTFFVTEDTIQPTVKAYNFSNNIQVHKNGILRWKIDDDFSGIADYNLYVDDVWQVLDYEYKRNEIFTSLQYLSAGQHELKLIVKDQSGNVNTSIYTIEVID